MIAAPAILDLTHDVPDEIEVHRVLGVRDLRPLRFKEFQAAANMNNEIDVTGSVAAKKGSVTRLAWRCENAVAQTQMSPKPRQIPAIHGPRFQSGC